MPGGRAKPLHLQRTGELWSGIVGLPMFGSFFVGLPLVFGPLWLGLLLGGLITLVGVVVDVPTLRELRRRGAWVPPGTARHPVLVSVVLVFLIMSATLTVVSALCWISELAKSPVLSAVLSAGLVGGVTVFLFRIALRVDRKPPPASGGSGTSEPSPHQQTAREDQPA